METTWIIVIVLAAIAFITLLIRRNMKDAKDSDPPLTDELEKEKKAGNDIK